MVTEKRIIVTSGGTLYPLGGISGPITKPFMCSVNVIKELLSESKVVYEVTPDGKRILLTRLNFNRVNYGGTEKTSQKDQKITNMQEALAKKSEKKSRFQFRVNKSDF